MTLKKLQNENRTAKPCKLLKGAAHGKLSRRPTITLHPANRAMITQLYKYIVIIYNKDII